MWFNKLSEHTTILYPIIERGKVLFSVAKDFDNYLTDWVLHLRKALNGSQGSLRLFYFKSWDGLELFLSPLNTELLDAKSATASLVIKHVFQKSQKV